MSDSGSDFSTDSECPSMPRKRKTEQEVPCAQYDFTYFINDDTEIHAFVQTLRSLFKMWTFQTEQCPSTGRLHYQGRGSLMKKKRFTEFKYMLSEHGIRLHVSPSSNPSQVHDIFYMMKLDTRVEGPWDNRSWRDPPYIPRQFRGFETKLYPYQQKIIDSKEQFEFRKVNLVYDPDGNSGKSTLAALGALRHGGFDIPIVSDSEKLMYTVCNKLRDSNCREPGLMFLDLPRSALHNEKSWCSFMSTIEQIKKGYAYDLRNHFKDWWFDSPQIWVFTNTLPEMKYLSKDRWVIWMISKDRDLLWFDAFKM